MGVGIGKVALLIGAVDQDAIWWDTRTVRFVFTTEQSPATESATRSSNSDRGTRVEDMQMLRMTSRDQAAHRRPLMDTTSSGVMSGIRR